MVKLLLGSLKQALDSSKVNYSVYYVKGGANITFELPVNNIRCSITCKTEETFYDLHFTVIAKQIVNQPKFIQKDRTMGLILVDIFETFLNLMEEIGEISEENEKLLIGLGSLKFASNINFQG